MIQNTVRSKNCSSFESEIQFVSNNLIRTEVTASDVRIYLNQMIDVRQNVKVCLCYLLFELHV
jgi:hypothetical protein